LVLPIGVGFLQELLLVRRNGGRITRTPIADVAFVPLIGEHGWPEDE